MEYGMRKADGTVITGPGWTCVADVVGSYAGFGVTRVYGALVRRSSDDQPWEEVHPPTTQKEA
jgi:hypothetical protein